MRSAWRVTRVSCLRLPGKEQLLREWLMGRKFRHSDAASSQRAVSAQLRLFCHRYGADLQPWEAGQIAVSLRVTIH